MKLISASICTSLLLLSGCASILNDSTQQVNVTSSDGKEVKGTVDGIPFTAPSIVSLRRENKSKVFYIETEGCAKQYAAEKNVDLKFFINILGGLYGLTSSTVDYASEKMWTYTDNAVIPCSRN